ncbi:MAG TPA: translocation/assembly module TamB domain-containing protein [Gemmatimonadaceae bacterium]|nr:translocation/assembly module TamB domain-containing protein [Gemmatimonadaceae bacterium]
MEPGDLPNPERAPAPRPPEEPKVVIVPRDEYALNWRRGILVGASMISCLILLAIIAVLVLTGTDWGRERVRRYAENWLNGTIHGRAKIGRLSGNLLVGMTVHNLTITDSAGEPFVAVKSFTADYSVMSLLRKHIWLDNAVAVEPLIVLDRKPQGEWNWQRIFPKSTTPQPVTSTPSWGDWLKFTDAAVVNGQLIVRSPWSPAKGLPPQARDSVVRDALGGGTRLMISRVPGGFQKTVQLDSVTAKIPLLRITQPGQPYRLLEVSALTMNAYPFRPPGAVVRDLKGIFPFNNDSIWWNDAYVTLPHSRASGQGRYTFSSGDMTLLAHSDPADFTDMRWVYPRLPTGHGKLDLQLSWVGAIQDYLIYNADVSMGKAHASGSFGITLSDTIKIHGTNVAFSGLDTRQLEQLIPHFSSPRRGTLAGRVRARGGRNALLVNGNVTFDDQRAGVSRLAANGEVGFPGKGMRARQLHVRTYPIQVAMAKTWYPTLPIDGTANVNVMVNGNTSTALALSGSVVHDDRGTHSALTGRANVALGGGKRFDVNVVAEPLSLAEVGRFVPSVGLQGNVAGPITATGTLANLRLDVNLQLPESGRFAARGTLDLAGSTKAYDIVSTLHTVNLRSVDSKAPITSLTARAAVRGAGTQLATMHATLAADLGTSRWDSIAVDTVSVRATLASGLAEIQRLYAAGAHTMATVSGTFGLTHDRSGTLTYVVNVDSLGAFNRWIPRSTGSRAPVQPRPQRIARAVAQARADSVRLARATEMQRMITGAPGPRLDVRAPAAVPSDTLSGQAYAAGKLSGNIYDFSIQGRAGGKNVVARGNFVRQFQAEYVWTNARTPDSKLAVGFEADSLSVMGFGFDTASLRLTYSAPGGHVELVTRQSDNREYGLRGDYALFPDRKELHLADMTFRFDTAYWAMPHPSTLIWGGPGLRVVDFELRNRGNGRVYANGLLPTSGEADFTFAVDNFPVSNIVDIVQTDVNATGVLTIAGDMRGTLSDPTFRGAFGLVQGTWEGDSVPTLQGTFGYADEALVTHVDALRNGQSITTVNGRVPINLAFTGVTGSRILPAPMAVDLVADSLPLELIPHFTDLVSNLHGHAFGQVSLRGTLKRPALVGALAWQHGSVMINQTGATINDIGASIRMANDTVYVDSIAGSAKGPVRVRGTLAVGNWREPTFNLYLVSNGAQLLNNQWGNLRVDAGLALTGPFTGAYLSGGVTITQGVIYAPEPTGRHLIGAGDPALFNVLDTAMVSDRALFPPVSPLLANLRMDIALNVRHDTWVRNREANVEIYTDNPVTVHEEQQALSLVGVVTTDRGEYNFMSKRFQIQRGSAMFIGSPDLNPTLQITGEYQVEVANRGALNISVIIGGTLRKPSLSLESDAQPPKTQSELLSLLAFGQSTTSLLAFSNSSIAGSAATGDLFGVGAQLAVQRLASVAVGVAVDQLEIQAGRAFGTDVFDITPGDNPLTGGTRAIGNFFTQTKIEAGKYVNPRTFVSAQEQASHFGAAIEHRTADGWHFNASIEPRILLLEPRLNSQPFRKTEAYGGFVLREWRF